MGARRGSRGASGWSRSSLPPTWRRARASRRAVWRNWAGDQRCEPAGFASPQTVGETTRALEQARATGRKVRVVASGHSFTDIACTDGLMLRLEGMRKLLDVDSSTGLVK